MTLTQITIVTVALLKLFLKIYVYEKYLSVILLFTFYRVIFISDSFNFDIYPDSEPASC